MLLPRRIVQLLVIWAVVAAAAEGARKPGKRNKQEEEAEPDDFDEPTDIDDSTSPEDGPDGFTEEEEIEQEERQPQSKAKGQATCDAKNIPTAELYLMSEYVEDFFEGQSSYEEVNENLRKINIRGAQPCQTAFNSLKNMTIDLLNEDESDTNAMVVYKALIRILNERLRELLELQKQANLSKMGDSPVEDTILLVKYEITSGEVDDAVEHFTQLAKLGVTIADVIDRAYEIQYLEKILLFLDAVSVDHLLEGSIQLYDYLINDDALDHVAADLFDEYLERFSSLKSAIAVVFIFNGMRYKLQERMDLIDIRHQERASLIAVEIKRGDMVSAMEKFVEFSEPKIEEIVRYSVLGNSMSFLTEFLDEFEDTDKIQASLAIMQLLGTYEAVQYNSDEMVFYEFLLRCAENTEDVVAQLLFHGMIRMITIAYPHLEPVAIPTSTSAIQGTVIMLQPRARETRQDFHQNFFSQYESSKATNYFEQDSHGPTCFYFDGRGSGLEGRPMMPLSPKTKWFISFEFKTIKKDGLLLAVENDPYNFGVFLRDGRVCVAHPSLLCTSGPRKFDDNVWHVATINYYGDGLLKIDVDRTAVNSGLPPLADRNGQIDSKRLKLIKSMRTFPFFDRRSAVMPFALNSSVPADTLSSTSEGLKEKKDQEEELSKKIESITNNNEKKVFSKKEKSGLLRKGSQNLEEILKRIRNGDNIRSSPGDRIRKGSSKAGEILRRMKLKAKLRSAPERLDLRDPVKRIKRELQRPGVEEPTTNVSRRMMSLPEEMPAASKQSRGDASQNNIFVGSIPIHKMNDFYGLEEAEGFQGEIRSIKVDQMPLLISKQEGTAQCLPVGRSGIGNKFKSLG